jgi:hypothetical protein
MFPKFLRTNHSSSSKSPIQSYSLAKRTAKSDKERIGHHHRSESMLYRPDHPSGECEHFERTNAQTPDPEEEEERFGSTAIPTS